MTSNNNSMPDLSLAASSKFVAAAGLIVDEVTPTTLRGHAELGADHHTPWGVIHGGLYATLVESAASIGASNAVADRGQFAVGVHNSTDFLRSSTGALVQVEAHAIHQGRTQQLWQVVISDSASGKTLARGQLRLQNLPRPDEG